MLSRSSKSGIEDNYDAEQAAYDYHRIARELAWESSGLAQNISLEVISRSMVPMLRPGDKVLVEKASPESLRIGDLVVVRRRGEFITHRLVGRGPHTWITKGDGLRHLDAPISKDALLGKVVVIERRGARINLQNNFWKLANLGLGHLHRWVGLFFRFIRAWKSRLKGKDQP